MRELNIKIVWMYHDIMDLYGDKGNMMVLKRRCEERGIGITIDTCGIGETCDLSTYDLIFLGGGADREQMMLIDDLLSRKENIQKAMDTGSFFFCMRRLSIIWAILYCSRRQQNQRSTIF